MSVDDYGNMLTATCRWICPKCDFFNFFFFLDFFFDDQLELVSENKFDSLSKDDNGSLSSNRSKETNFSSKTFAGLKLISIKYKQY